LCIFFFGAKELNAKNIYKEMFPVYGGKFLSSKMVHYWIEKVTDGARPGGPVEIGTKTSG
jgi:hypothetical protein